MIISSEINQEITRMKFVVQIASELGYRGLEQVIIPRVYQ